MRILVIGGTGFIGRHVVRRLAETGHTVAVFHRGRTETNLPKGVTHLEGNRAALARSAQAFERFAPEVVIDLIAYTKEEAQATMDAFSGLVQRAVVVSSGDVYRNYDGLRGHADHAPDPAPLAEDAPLRETRYPYRAQAESEDDRMYHYEKILVERAFMDTPGLEATVLRLPMVYGPGDAQHRLWPYLRRMDDGRPAILLGAAQAMWQVTRGYVENVAAAIAQAAADERAAGRVYNVGEAEALAEADWVQRIGEVAGWHGQIACLSEDQLPSHLQTSLDWRYPLVLDTRRLRQDLRFAEPAPSEEALRRTIAWLRAHPPDTGPPDYAAEDAALARWRAASGAA